MTSNKLTTLLVLSVCAVFSDCALITELRSNVDDYIEAGKNTVNQRYRLEYHVAAPIGWINDPNGFSYYQEKYHLFYQYYPYDTVWGPMHWGHVTSRNLVEWEHQPVALIPEEEMCFSGSAYATDDQLLVMYTAHIDLGNGHQNQTQYVATSTDGILFEKYEGNPVISSTPDFAEDFRDPKVWKHEDTWYVILGSKTHDNRGRVLLYRSQDFYNWEFVNVLAEADDNMGYMWECPDFFELDGRFVLLLSPQGIKPEGDKFRNIYQTGYFVGTFDYTNYTFLPIQEFRELEYGHDFYASQTTEAEGRRLLVSWFGTWKVPFPESVDGWAGAMTIVRELHLNSDGTLVQKPVSEMELLREYRGKSGRLSNKETVEGLGSAVEVLLRGEIDKDVILQLEGLEGGDRVVLKFDSKQGKVIVDRGSGDIRERVWNPTVEVVWRIFLDTSSVELFCGDGEVVFSSRVYKLGEWRITNRGAMVNIETYKLRRGIE